MKITKTLRTPVIYSLIAFMVLISIQPPAMAAIVGTQDLTMQAELQTQRDEVRELMARDDVREALVGYGVSQADVDKRIDNLTAGELLQIQSQMADLPAGGDGVLGIVLGIILIFILLDLLGATDVFPGI